MSINVVIVENELLAAERLKKLIMQIDNNIQIVCKIDSVKDAIEYFKNNSQPDLIFMDIELGDGKTLEIFESVKISSRIIFVTAHDDYALQAFKFNSIDYILKPVKREELSKAMEKFMGQFVISKAINSNTIYEKLYPGSKKTLKSRFLAKRGSRYFSIESSEVAYIYTKERMVFLKTNNSVDYLIDNKLDDLETELDPSQFYRANRQYILSYKSIGEVIVWFDGKLKLFLKPKTEEEIIVSRLKSTDFKEWLSK
ncbi:MAG: LytTR family DNA-binding domain-containing protein [Ginsengibacter sp.]